MSNGNAAEGQAAPAFADAATTPIDLASAFKALNKANREAAEEPVETGDDGNGEQGAQGDGAEYAGGAGAAEEIGTASDAGGYGDGEPDDGSSDFVEAIDFNAFKQDLLRNVQRNAAAQVRKEFDDQNIGYYSAAELTVRDEQTGQVRFRNPDVQDERNPDYYFKSRADMMSFIQAWNQGVDFEYRKAVNEKQQQLLMYEAPKARLVDFMPKWQAMDDVTKQVFDSLLEGHEVRDAQGREIGFNVNLDAVAAQAAKIARSFGGGVQVAQEQAGQDSGKVAAPAAGGPAMDMRTGNGKSADEKEPKTIGEALAMLDKKNKGGK